MLEAGTYETKFVFQNCIYLLQPSHNHVITKYNLLKETKITATSDVPANLHLDVFALLVSADRTYWSCCEWRPQFGYG